jgi:hypothetical protein
MKCPDFALKQREIFYAKAFNPLSPKMLEGRSQNPFPNAVILDGAFSPDYKVMRMNKIKKYLKWLFIFFLLILVIILVPNIYIRVGKGTDVVYQSSDGEWSDFECNMKGRNFEFIVLVFESYKIRCQKTNAILQRITRKPRIYNLSWWFDDFNDPKWKVPYTEHRFLPIQGEKNNCYNRDLTSDEIKTAQKLAEEYISSLNKPHN